MLFEGEDAGIDVSRGRNLRDLCEQVWPAPRGGPGTGTPFRPRFPKGSWDGSREEAAPPCHVPSGGHTGLHTGQR